MPETVIQGLAPPPQAQIMRLGNVPGAQDFTFDVHIAEHAIYYYHRDEPPPKGSKGTFLCGGVPNRETAVSLVTIFGMGLLEASRLRGCPWPLPILQQETKHGT